MLTVSFIGDSITDGTGYCDVVDNTTWIYRLMQRLGETSITLAPLPNFTGTGTSQNNLIKGGQYRFENVGWGGQTTTMFQTRFATDVIAHKPDIVFINGGINDITSGVPKATTLSNIENMVVSAKNAGIEVILSTLNPFTDFGTWGGTATTARQYNVDIFQHLATKYDIPIVDFNAVLSDANNFYTVGLSCDNIHPNSTATQMMANAIPLGLIRDMDGAGTPSNPWRIYTKADFNRCNLKAHTDYFSVMNDINFNNSVIESIAWEGAEVGAVYVFEGGFTGNGYTISNGIFTWNSSLTTGNKEASIIGFMGSQAGAVFEDIIIKNCTFGNDTAVVWCAPVGLASNTRIPDTRSIIRNIRVDSCTFAGKGNAGIVAIGGRDLTNESVEISKCSVTNSTLSSNTYYTGGLVASFERGVIENCYTSGCTMTSPVYIAGIAFSASGIISMKNCYSANSIPTAAGNSAFVHAIGTSVVTTTNSYYNSTLATSVARTGLTGLTTTQMKDASVSAIIRGLLNGVGVGVWNFVQGQYPTFMAINSALLGAITSL